MYKFIMTMVLVMACLVTGQADAKTLLGTFAGKTYYVSKTGSNGAGTDWATAKRTIQDAIDLCVAGDTVLVDEGDYADTTDVAIGQSGIVPTVAYINKRIRLVSRYGKERTHIVGKWSDDGAGAGVGAHRGIYITQADVLVEGFTIRDCATVGADSGVNNYFSNGGGVAATATSYLVNCTVDNCRAGQGGALGYFVIPINCVISRSIAKGVIQAGYRTGNAYNTVFIGCGTGSGYVLPNVQDSTAVNCTFIANDCTLSTPNKDPRTRLYNCAILDGAATPSANVIATNCVTSLTAANDRIVIASQEPGNPTHCTSGVARRQCLSPITGDWRPVVGSDLIDAGADAYTKFDWIPTEYQTVDFYGNPRKVGAAVDAGAVEAQDAGVVPATATIRFSDATAIITVGGKVHRAPAKNLWLGFDAFPGQIRIVPVVPDGKVLYGCMLDGVWNSYDASGNMKSSGGYRFPDRGTDGGFWLTPPATDEGDELVISQRLANRILRVPSEYATIQAAVDEVVATDQNFDVILVAPGRYTGAAESEACVKTGASLVIRSEEGPEKTIIDGEGVRRCVWINTASANFLLQGFTLTGGCANGAEMGGGFCTTPCSTKSDVTTLDAIRVQLADCIVSNNVARSAAGSYGGWIQRCYFKDNRQNEGTTNERGSAVRHALITGSIFDGNPYGNISAVAWAFAYNTTFAESTPGTFNTATFRPFDRNTTAINCALYGGYVDACNEAIVPPAGVVHENGRTERDDWLRTFADGEIFLDGSAGDYRMLASSAARTAGRADAYRVHRYMTGDFDGRAIRFVNGMPVPGAIQTPVTVVAVDCRKDFAITPSRHNVVTPGESVTLTITPDAAHPVVGWVVGGVTNDTADTSIDVTLPVGKELVRVEPLFKSDLYVDAVNGVDDEAHDGTTPAKAKKTLAAILALASIGDTVSAAPGDYAAGTMTYENGIVGNKGYYMPSRAVVPEGVSLVATEGKDVTFITGEFDPNASDHKGGEAVRGVTLLARARLKGFTIRRCATMGRTGAETDDNVGAGVFAPWPVDGDLVASALIEDCTITNCFARTGAGVYGGIVSKCRIVNTSASAGGCSVDHSRVEQSLLVNAYGQTSVMAHHGLYSTTICAKGNSRGTNRDMQPQNESYPIENCIVLTPNSSTPGVLKNVHNVLWYVGSGSNTFDQATCSGIIEATGTSIANAQTQAGLDAFSVPMTRTAAPIDQGDVSRLANLLTDVTTDLDGNPRVANDGKIDLGAVEWDWRGDYTAALLKKRLTVVSADASTKLLETVDGTNVVLTTGGIVAVWSHDGKGVLRAPVEVTGTGVLTVSVDGETLATVTAADGLRTMRVVPGGRENTIAFTYVPGLDDTGVAVLYGMKNSLGFQIVIR